MTDLIERLESATGPDRELDYLIALELRCPKWRDLKPWEKTNGWAEPDNARDAWSCLFYDTGGNPKPVPDHTASIDAALTLVPEGWGYSLYGSGFVRLMHPINSSYDIEARAATPARSICIAALRAHLERNPDNG